MKDRIGKEVLGEITVFERDERIGGRKSFSSVELSPLVCLMTDDRYDCCISTWE